MSAAALCVAELAREFQRPRRIVMPTGDPLGEVGGAALALLMEASPCQCLYGHKGYGHKEYGHKEYGHKGHVWQRAFVVVPTVMPRRAASRGVQPRRNTPRWRASLSMRK